MNLKTSDRVALLRDIRRIPEEGSRDWIPYAHEGDEGIIEEIFRASMQSMGEKETWHAKVRMLDGSLKTFRLTSLEKIL